MIKEKGGWAKRLQLYFYKKLAVYNMGISDDSSSNIVKRINNECTARGPEILIIYVGVVDASLDKNENEYISREKFIKNLSKIKEYAQIHTKKVLFTSTHEVNEKFTCPFPLGRKPYFKNKNIKEYSELVKKFCRTNKLGFIEMYNLLDINNDYDDGLHPNTKGHEKIFIKVKDYLIKNKII